MKNFIEWCKINYLTISKDKCSVLYLGKNNPQTEYFLDSYKISKVKTNVRDLGILINPKLKWVDHIKNKRCIALGKFFSLLKAFKSVNPQLLTKLYTTYVRPILEFSCSVFNSFCKKDIKILERTQKSITKSIFRRCFKATYPEPPLYHIRLGILELESLENRRTKIDLVTLHKILIGKIFIQPKNFPKPSHKISGFYTRVHS